MRSSGNNDNSVILLGRHAGISSFLQCLGRLSQPIAIGVTAALGIAVGPIYQRGALKNHSLYNYLYPDNRNQPWYAITCKSSVGCCTQENTFVVSPPIPAIICCAITGLPLQPHTPVAKYNREEANSGQVDRICIVLSYRWIWKGGFA